MNRKEKWEAESLRLAAKHGWRNADSGEPLRIFDKLRCDRKGRPIRTECSKRHTAAYNYGYNYRLDHPTENNPFACYDNSKSDISEIELRLYVLFRNIKGVSYRPLGDKE